MFSSLKDKLVVVTGGEKGIGKAVVEKFVEAGSKVVIAGIDEKCGSKIEQEMAGKVTFVKTDVSQESQIEKFSQKISKKFGNINILINNAGIHREGNLATTEFDEWQQILDINLNGAFLMAHYIVKDHMIPNQKGVIVNISSEAGIDGFKNQVAYNVSKAALISLTKSTAVDLADENIRVNAVCPGTTMTPLVEQNLKNVADPEAAKAELENIRPLKRLGDPEEIAMAVLAMSADELGYATGSILSIDGGSTAS